jgi:hypothetical protein
MAKFVNPMAAAVIDAGCTTPQIPTGRQIASDTRKTAFSFKKFLQ